MFHFYSMHILIGHKNDHIKIFARLWAAYNKSWQILSSGNIIIALSLPSFVGTQKFMLVACLVGPENNLKLFY